jgi:hypothetical protein
VADLRGALGASDLLDFVPAIAQTLEHFTKLPKHTSNSFGLFIQKITLEF